eukprot:GHRR01017568.1.p1 GENE.GHRR01017568.1~~GHRR01017568.1.p1  ORF type:complete len:620 (+),score=238.42 GHRR01017568.1:338-2197(+)
MSTRAAIRPRPLDVNKQLLTVRELSELDTVDSQSQPGADNNSHAAEGHGHGHGHGHNQNKKPKAIPIPDIREVETHYRDYLPLFSHPLTYIHGKGCGGNREPDPIEYDLDNEDEDWLQGYNIGRSRLSDTLFEKMLWKLEIACAEALENTLTAAGAGPSERTAASAVAAIDHLPKQEAVRLLTIECGGREKLVWDVYQYWVNKRKRWGKPILRRLQAPTAPSDQNPYNTFRSREKVNRPQTRRRRDNSDELMEKLRQLRDNLSASKQIMEELVRRERRKRDLACTEVELLRIRYRHWHDKLPHEQISSEGLTNLRERIRINGQNDQIRAGARILANKMTLPAGVPFSKKQRREGALQCIRPYVAQMQLPPPAPEPEALWVMPPNLLQIPLESKGAQRARLDTVRVGKVAATAASVTAARAGGSGGGAAATSTPPAGSGSVAAADGPAAAAVGTVGTAAQCNQAGAGAAAADGTAEAGGSSKAAAQSQEQQTPAAPAAGGGGAAGGGASQQPSHSSANLPPPGPSAGSTVSGRMSAVMMALNERQHLYQLPAGLAGSLGSWRCFIGRGGRVRLERVDHVTHESLNAIKQEHQNTITYYHVSSRNYSLLGDWRRGQCRGCS